MGIHAQRDFVSASYAPLASPEFTGYPLFKAIKEDITASAVSPASTVNFDVSVNNSILYYTNQTNGNWTMNIRGSSSTSLNSILNNGESLSLVFLCTNGSAGYYQTGFQIDGSSVTPKWQGASAPTAGNPSNVDAYSFVIIKTASAQYTVLESLVGFA